MDGLLRWESAELEQPRLKQQEPSGDDREDHQPEIIQFKLSFLPFHNLSLCNERSLNLSRGIYIDFVSGRRSNAIQFALKSVITAGN